MSLSRQVSTRMIIAETERLLLRPFHAVDDEAMLRIFGDPEVMRFGSGTKDLPWIRDWLVRCLADYHARWGFGLWAVVHKSQGAVIGYSGLSRFADVGGQPETEIGYRLARDFWGQGLATEAATAVRYYAFGTLNLSRLIALIDPRNLASIRVAQKVGLTYEKEVVFQGFLDHVYAISRPTGG
jgi:RimJ/RimL family protein N-acetyltransferase